MGRSRRRWPSAGNPRTTVACGAFISVQACASTRDGTFTARDVKKTFEALLENPAAPSFAAPGLKKVLGHDDMVRNRDGELRGIEVIDEHTVDVRFSDPCAIFPFFKFLIVDVDFVKAHGPDWFMKGSAGTGPYRFSTWQPGVRVDLTSHDEWWDGGPAHGKVSFVVVGGREASITAFNNNDADVVLIDADLVRKTVEGSGFRRSLISCPRMQTRSIALLQDRYPPFRDKRVRLAMSMMIDREAVAERFFRGMAASTTASCRRCFFPTPGTSPWPTIQWAPRDCWPRPDTPGAAACRRWRCRPCRSSARSSLTTCPSGAMSASRPR